MRLIKRNENNLRDEKWFDDFDPTEVTSDEEVASEEELIRLREDFDKASGSEAEPEDGSDDDEKRSSGEQAETIPTGLNPDWKRTTRDERVLDLPGNANGAS